jgi:cyclophilin family peptidyl-prolyl cis-trans isomerase
MIRQIVGPLLLVSLSIGTAWSATPAKKSAAKTTKAADTEEVGVIETNMGTIVIRFYDKDAPLTVANFKKLANSKFYDGTTFHRVIPQFVIQGGDPNSKDSDRSNDGLGGPGYTVPAEIKQLNKRGAVATARLPDQVNPKRESSGSQFYICLADLGSLDKGGYTVFGTVIEGMDVVDKISQVQRDDRDNPVTPVVMKKVSIEKRPLAKSGSSGSGTSSSGSGSSGA